MAILDTILSTPVNIAKLRLDKKPLESLLSGAFTNLLYYAKSHWSYTASGSTGGDALLAGTATSAPCGGIATALKRVFIDGLGIPETDIEYIRVTGYVWTDPQYTCFDPKVHGNLRKLDGARVYNLGCIFNEHYYLKCQGKYYDPCLSTVYMIKDQSIKENFAGKGTMVVGTRKMLATRDRKTCILYMPLEPVPGFQGAWAMFEATKKNIEKALGSQDFKKELASMGGTTGFAQFVKTLK
jgi:hypothetical protein